MDDVTLVRRAAETHDAACKPYRDQRWERKRLELEQRLRGAARRWTKGRCDDEDFVKQVVEVVENGLYIDHGMCRAHKWMHYYNRTVRLACISVARRLKRQPVVDPIPADHQGVPCQTQTVQGLSVRIAVRRLAKSDDQGRKQVTAIVLTKVLGWTRREVAELLGVTEDSVTRYVREGMQRLRELLGQCGYTCADDVLTDRELR